MRILVCTADVDPCPAGSVSSVALTDLVDFASLGIDAATVLYVFSWGFGAVVLLWSFGYAVGAAVRAIRRA